MKKAGNSQPMPVPCSGPDGCRAGAGESPRRTVSRRMHKAVLGLLVSSLLFMPSLVSAEDGRAYIDLSAGFKTGDFGTPVRSNLYYFLPAWGYVSSTYDVSISAPYLFLSDDNGGQSNGLGDIVLRGGRALIPEGSTGVSLHGALALKLPTADETRGLGTGETDYGAFLTLHKRFDTLKLSLMAGYLKIGDPPALDYDDSYSYGVGLSWTTARTSLYASLEGRRAIVAGAENPLEINLGFMRALDARYMRKGSAFAGLNDGGPAFGIAAGMVRWF